jgi:flagellar biosynthesis regulator FlaF
MAHSRNSKTRIKAARRGIEAMKLRESGLNYAEIGEKMSVSEQRAWKLVSKEFDLLQAKRMEMADRVSKLEAARLDKMFNAVWAKAQKGNLPAMKMVLEIMQRRAKLLGLDLADKNSPVPVGNLTLNISEVVVEKQTEYAEVIENNGGAPDGARASSPALIPAE